MKIGFICFFCMNSIRHCKLLWKLSLKRNGRHKRWMHYCKHFHNESIIFEQFFCACRAKYSCQREEKNPIYASHFCVVFVLQFQAIASSNEYIKRNMLDVNSASRLETICSFSWLGFWGDFMNMNDIIIMNDSSSWLENEFSKNEAWKFIYKY